MKGSVEEMQGKKILDAGNATRKGPVVREMKVEVEEKG